MMRVGPHEAAWPQRGPFGCDLAKRLGGLNAHAVGARRKRAGRTVDRSSHVECQCGDGNAARVAKPFDGQ